MQKVNGWLDLPVVQAIDYFSGVLAQAYSWASRYALIIGIIGLSWTAFRLLTSRMQIKDAIWDTIFKWIGFLLLMSIYPMMTKGLSVIGNEIGQKAGAGETTIIAGLTELRDALKKDIAAKKTWENEDVSTDLATESLNLNNKKLGSSRARSYEDMGWDSPYDPIKDAQQVEQIIASNRRKRSSTDRMLGKAATLKAIESVLVEKPLDDGDDGIKLVDSYVTLDLWLKTKEGNDDCYLSPSAIIRIGLLGCQILWEKQNAIYLEKSQDLEDNPKHAINSVANAWDQLQLSLAQIPAMIMVFVSCVILIFSILFAVIQYIMMILEYTIVTAIGAIFIPFILFDGTKDIPKKLIPVFTAFLIKIIVVTICMFFVIWILLTFAVTQIQDDGGMNLIMFAQVAFNSVICYALTQNAPKIAQTILTGQPQMSMGEFVAAAVTSATIGQGITAAGMNAAKGAYNASHTVAGEGKKVAAAASQAGADAREANFTEKEQGQAMWRAAGSTITQDLKERIKGAGHSFMNKKTGNAIANRASQMVGVYGGGGGAGGSGSSGENPHTRYGTDKNGHMLSTTSNQSFAKAIRYDPKTNSNVSMTGKEYDAEKQHQGATTGRQVVKDMQKKREQAQQNNQQGKNQNGTEPPNDPPDSITGGERAL